MKISTRRYLEVVRVSLDTLIMPELRSEAAKRAAGISSGALGELLKREMTTEQLLASAFPEGIESARELALLNKLSTNSSDYAQIDGVERDIEALSGRPRYMEIYRNLLSTIEHLMRGAHESTLSKRSLSRSVIPCLARAAAWENWVEQSQLSQAVQKQSPATTRGPAEALTQDKLQRFLQRCLPDEREVEVQDLEVVPAGMVHDTYQFTLRSASRVTQELIVRKTKGEPFAKMNCFELHKEFDLVRCLTGAGYLLPEAFWLGRGVAGVSGDFYVMRKARGSKNADLFNVSAAISEAVLLQMAQKLGELHSLPLKKFGAYIERHGNSDIYSQTAEQATRQNLADWYEAWQGFDRQPCATEIYLFAWLAEHLPANSAGASLVHTDFTPHNCLWEGDELTAVLDWESAHFGDPAEDIAYIKPHIEARMDWSKFLNHYYANGGREVGDQRIAYFTCYAHMRTVVLANVLVTRVEKGENSDVIGLQADYEYLPRTLEMCLAGIRSAETLFRQT